MVSMTGRGFFFKDETFCHHPEGATQLPLWAESFHVSGTGLTAVAMRAVLFPDGHWFVGVLLRTPTSLLLNVRPVLFI